MILLMLASLVGPFLILALLGRLKPAWAVPHSIGMRVGVSLFLLGPAVSHFTSTGAFVVMLPSWVPARESIIYATGVAEFAGAVGVWIPGLVKLTGVLLIVMLLCFLPANIYAALNADGFGGSGQGPLYLLVRIPFQFFAAWWIAVATGQNWLHRPPSFATRRETNP